MGLYYDRWLCVEGWGGGDKGGLGEGWGEGWGRGGGRKGVQLSGNNYHNREQNYAGHSPRPRAPIHPNNKQNIMRLGGRERERKRQTETKTERQTETERRETDRHRDREKRDRQADRQRQTDRQTDRHRDREKRERQRQSEEGEGAHFPETIIITIVSKPMLRFHHHHHCPPPPPKYNETGRLQTRRWKETGTAVASA